MRLVERKELKDLNLLDRFLFSEAIEDPETMEIILEIILGKEVILKHLPQAEKEQRTFQWSKQVRLDVWAQDIDDNIYDTEVQKRDTKDLPKRSRMYNSVIDSKLLDPGNVSYNKLNDVYIIIISPFDLFGEGRFMYTFNMKCSENPNLELGDGATRIFLNTRGTDPSGCSEELIEMLKYFETTTVGEYGNCISEKVRKLQNKIERIKASEEMGVKYMNLWEEKLLDRQDGYEEGKEDGREEGKKMKAFEIAGNLKKAGIDVSVIAQNTGLTIKEIEEL